MNALIQDLENKGIELRIIQNEVELTGCQDVLTPDLIDEVRRHKKEILRDSMNAYHEQAVDRLNQFQWAPGQTNWTKIRAMRNKLEADITEAWNKVDIEQYKQAVDEWEALFLTQARSLR